MLELTAQESEILIEKNRPAMERIWKKLKKEITLPPTLKGDYIKYIATDPQYLYQTGFVDTQKFTFDEWEKAFEECKQTDNTYLISKEQFIKLGKFKFAGLVKKPLDPMKLREGWYSTQSWHEFCVKSILPSTTLTIELLIEAEKRMKDGGQIVNGQILVDKQVKLRIKYILDNYPSPSRRRELSVAEAYEQIMQEESARSKSPIVKTTFVSGQKLGDVKKGELKEALLKSSQIKSKIADDSNTLSLKDLKKKSSPRKSNA